MKTMKLSEGTVCYGSQKGYYNFYYPNMSDVYELAISLEVKKLNWVGTTDFEAVQVISPENHLPFEVIWIRTEPA